MRMEVSQISVKNMETKEQIRNDILKKRSEIEKKDLIRKSDEIYSKLIVSSHFLEAENVLFYADYNHEVMTHSMIQHALKSKKSVFCPKVCKDEIRFYRIERLEDLTGFYKGIQEPESEDAFDFSLTDQTKKSLVVMPGVAFDLNRNRLGYGKGYYDRFLEKNSSLYTIALALECQIVDHIPANEHDIRPEYILTEERVI